jgi:hypothetical protein
MLLVPVIGWAKRAVVAKTFINSASSTANASSYDFGNFTAPTAGLMVVAALPQGGSSNVSAINIGGVAGALLAATNSDTPRALGWREVSAGDHNVTVVCTGSFFRAAIGVWLLTGYQSATPTDTDTPSFATSTSVSASINVQAGGAVIVAGSVVNTNGINWTNATEDFDIAVESAARMSGASLLSATAQTGLTITQSGTGSNQRVIIAAAWR